MKNNLSAPAALLASVLASTSLTAAPACNPTSVETCGLPFPSNHLTVPDASSPTGKRPQFDDGVLSSGVLAELRTRTGLAPAELFNESSGFSAASPVVFELSGAPGVSIPEDGGDLVQAFDLSTGERVPVRARISEYARSAEVSTPAEVLEVFPADRWMYGHDILVVLTSGLALSGDHRDLAEVFAATDNNDYLADLAERLEQQGLAPDDVINATTFTVRDRREVVTPLNTLVEEIRSSDRPVRNLEVDYSYLTWFSAGEVTGEVLLENYRADQGTGMVDFDATPTEQWVGFTLSLPASARNGSVPVALYAHSLGGDQTPPLLTRFVNSLGGVATFSIDFPNHGARATQDGGGLGDPGGFPLGLMTQASLDFAAAEAALRSSLADLDIAGPRTWYNWRGRYGDGVADINVNDLILQGEGKAGERFDALSPGFLQTSLFQVEDASLTRLLAEGDLWDLFPGLVPAQATGAEALMIRSAIQQALDYGDAINFGDLPVYTVNVNAGSGGQVTPAGSHDLIRGQRGVFTLIPDSGYEVDSASGCGGALADNVYTTGPVSGNCTVSVSFRPGETTEPDTFTVSVSSDAGGTLSPAEDQIVAEGETASFTVSTETGYSLVEVTGCDGTLSGNVYTTGAIAADCAVSASFESLQYEVSASAGSGGTISPAGTQSVTHGDNAHFTLAAESGYSLANVEGCDGSLSGNTYTTGSITSDCSVTASFTMDPVSVLVVASAGNGGSISPTGTQSLTEGQTTTFTVSADAGYNVAVVSGCGGTLSGNTYTTGTLTADCAVTASFDPMSIEVGASAGDGGSISPSGVQSLAYGETASFTVSADEGYSVAGVSGCGGTLSGDTYTTAALTADCAVAASFDQMSVEVSASADDGGSISPSGVQSLAYGETASFTVAADEGYSVASVSGCGGSLSGNTYTTVALSADCAVTVSFDQNLVEVSASAGDGGSISPSGVQSLAYGETASFTVTADEGYSVAGVSGCDGSLSGDTYTTGALTADCAVTASFDQNVVEVNASASEGGSISPSGVQSLAYGETATFTVAADEGYSVAGVSGCEGSLSGDTFTTGALTADCAVTASFDQNLVEVSASVGDGGSISPGGVQSLAYGETASFTVSADEGYSVANVSGCGGTLSGDTYTTGALTTDCAVTVSFDQQMFEVTASAENGGSLSPAGIQSVAYGDRATFSVAVNEGYELQTVNGCGGSLSGDTYTTGAITSACSVQASFQEVEPDPAEGAAGRASGVIRDGQVALSVWNGSEWVPQGSPVETNEAGYFSLDYPETNQPVRLELTAIAGTTMRCPLASGCGVNTGFGEFFPVDPETFALSAIVPGDHLSGDGVVTISPLTHMAASWVEGLPLGPTNAGVELALTRIRTLFGLDEGFATRLPVDLAEPEEVSAATEADLRHALLASAFPELAFGTSTDQTVVYELETLLQGAGQMFNLLGGQAVVRSGEFSVAELEQLITDLGGDPATLLAEYDLTDVSLAGLDSLVAAAASVSGNLLDGDQELSLTESLMDLLLPYGDRIITNLGGTTGFDPADMDRALVVLDDFDQFHKAAQAGSAGIDEVNRNLAWLTADESGSADSQALGEAVNEAFGYIGSAAICHLIQSYSSLSSCIAGLEEYPLDSPDGYARLRVTDETSSFFGSRMNAGELILNGTRPGNQQVDLVIDTFNLGELLDGEPRAFDIQGTIANSTATYELDLRVGLDLSGNPEANSHFQSRSSSWLWWTSSSGANGNEGVDKLLADLRFGISLQGSVSITSTDPSIGTYEVTDIDAEMLFNRRVLTRGASGAVLDVALRSGNRTNPAGETSSGLSGQDIFRLILSDPVSLSMARVSDELGVPPVEFRSSGTLAGSGPFLDVLGEYITAALDPDVPLDSVDFEQLTEGLNLDMLSMDGGSELRILDPAGARTYNIASRDGALVVSSPNSEEDALSLIQAGVAGYIYSDDSLISTVHLGNVEDGLLLSLVNGERRSYRNGAGGEPQSLDAIMEQLRAILENLSNYFAIDTGEESP